MADENLIPIRLAKPVGVGVGPDGKPMIVYASIGRPRPVWPELPFNPNCITATANPRDDVVAAIQRVLPQFDPSSDAKWWLTAAEVVLSTGRSRHDVEQMSYDEVAAFFTLHGEHLLTGGVSENATTGGKADVGQPTPRGPTTCERLRTLWETDAGKLKIVQARTPAKIGKLIERGATAVKTSPFFKKTVRPGIRAYCAINKYEIAESFRDVENETEE